MIHSSDIMSPKPVPIPVQRNVYSYVEQPSGQRVYVAITSTGDLLNAELRRRLPDETHASIIRDMWIDLDRQDPVSDLRPLGLWVDGERRR